MYTKYKARSIVVTLFPQVTGYSVQSVHSNAGIISLIYTATAGPSSRAV